MSDSKKECLVQKSKGLESVKLSINHLLSEDGHCSDRHIFLFDASGSMAEERILMAKKAAMGLFNDLVERNVERNKNRKNKCKVWDHCVIGSFCTGINWLTKLNQTNRNGKNGDRFQKQLDSKITIGGATALRDAIAETYSIIDELDKQFIQYTKKKPKTYFYVLTDEEDNSSSMSPKELDKIIQSSDVKLNIIHISEKDDDNLKGLCSESKGIYERVEVLTEISLVVRKIITTCK